MAQVLTKFLKGPNAQLLSGFRTASQGSIWKHELHEVFREDVGSRSSECVHAVHLHLVVNTDRDDVARIDRPEVDSLV
jgi:hypothetical protein